MSVYTTVFLGATPAGNTMTGAVAGGFGTPVAVLIGGSVALAAGCAAGLAAFRNRAGMQAPGVLSGEAVAEPVAEAAPPGVAASL
jgi:hypothetical protein